MSEEEKKAIELLKNKNTEYYYRFIDVRDAVSTLLNLIKKQQKEIQRLEKDNDTLSELVIVNEDKVIKELDLISKDKIRELLKSKDIELTGVISYRELEELLEE